jgi:hypothetical protein
VRRVGWFILGTSSRPRGWAREFSRACQFCPSRLAGGACGGGHEFRGNVVNDTSQCKSSPRSRVRKVASIPIRLMPETARHVFYVFTKTIKKLSVYCLK